MTNLKQLLEERKILLLDGGMGTQLQARGMRPGEIPEEWNLQRPNDVRAVHAAYVAAGSSIVVTNTFGANPAKYHGSAPLADVITAAVRIARESGAEFVALDVGPTGRLLKPAGDFAFDDAYESFAEQIRLGVAAGVDLIAIETMSDLYELKAAVLAAKENCDLPVIATVALDAEGKLLTGASVEVVAAVLEGLHVDAIGFNCGLGPDLMLPFVKRLIAATTLPVVVKPNAGLPKVIDGKTVFAVGPEDFARDVLNLVRAGASIVGGCCGTTPAHINAIRNSEFEIVVCNRSPITAHQSPTTNSELKTIVTSYARAIELPFNDSLIIGERINPTGKKKLKEAYRTGDVGYVLREAIAQVEAGAHLLDVNAGVPGIDEAAVLDATVQAIQSVTDVPLQIDTASPEALERALRHYNGKALINSVNGKEEVMDAVFPLVAKYGGVVVALTLDENGIPSTAEGRLEIARKILKKGAEYGLKPNDFVIDVLCLAVSADSSSVPVILKSLKLVREELGCRTVLGVSNVSFGLPARAQLNATFYALALEAGLTTAIVNPLSVEMMTAYKSWRALTGRDAQCEEWIKSNSEFGTRNSELSGNSEKLNETGKRESEAENQFRIPNSEFRISNAIVHGLKSDAATYAGEAIKGGAKPVDVIDGEIVPALERVGKGFEAGKVFLPQLLMAAEAAGAAFEVIRAELEKSGVESPTRGPVVIATVKGDIHDIGKNIVRALLENYGFKVIDLGRDVAPEKIVETVKQLDCKLVGLSALMTTTVPFMEETIKLLKQEKPDSAVVVGGAVLTADYASQIGATYYAKDAMATVRIADNVFAG